MAKIKLDLTNYRSNGDYVDPGTYEVIVDDVELTRTKAGDPMLNVWFLIQSGEHEGRTVMDRFPIMDKALWRIVKFLNAVGIKTPRKEIPLDTARIKNKRLVITVVDGKPYNNRVRSEVDDYFAAKKPAATAPEPMEDEDDYAEPEESVSSTEADLEDEADLADEKAAKGASPDDAGKPETEEESEDDGELDDLEDLEVQ